jgi:hypothetical protein
MPKHEMSKTKASFLLITETSNHILSLENYSITMERNVL